MRRVTIKTFNPKNQTDEYHFFVQSKGLHSGRPEWDSRPNCFILNFETLEECEMCFYLCHMLYASGYWKEFLLGSVIPFLRVSTFNEIFGSVVERTDFEHPEYQHTMKVCQVLEKQEENLYRQIAGIREMKTVILRRQMAFE